MSGRLRFGDRLLVRLYPRELREAAGWELARAARQCVDRERRIGGRAGAALARVRLIADAVATAFAWHAPRLFDRTRHYRSTTEPPPAPRRTRPEAFMDNLRKDLVYTLRAIRRQPGFALVVILILALGIGANTAVFSVLNGVVLKPLPYPEPERLELVTTQFPTIGFDQFWMSLPEFVEFRDHNHAFASVGGYREGTVNLMGSEQPSRAVSAVVTPELMPTLGVRPAAGRWFTEADSLPNAEPVAILSTELWQRTFGSDPGVVGRVVKVDDADTRIVGIMPPGFDVHDANVRIWLPLTIDPSTFPNSRSSHFLYLIGRLKPGVDIEQARSDADTLVQQWRTFAPTGHIPDPERHRLRIDPLKEDMIGGVRLTLMVLQAAVAFVLLIACVNLANLLIARADARMREYAVRTALGASRRRVFMQLVTEGVVLSLAGAAAGVGLAWGGLQWLVSVNADAIPRLADVTLDWRVLGFTLLIAVLTGFVFGLVPLLRLGRGISQSLRDTGTRSAAGAVRARVRSALVVVETAMAVLLVVGAGLLLRSFFNLTHQDLGFDRAQLTTFGIELPGRYDAQHRVAFYQDLTTKLNALPGVTSAAAMSGLPPLRNVNANTTDFEHIPNMRPAGSLPVENVDFWQGVTVGYVDTMGIPVVEGRAFEPADVGGAPVAMVNEALAKKFFEGRDPVGGHVKPGYGNDELPWFTIVGVLKDVKQGGVAAAAGTELYLLDEQLPRTVGFAYGSMNLVVRSTRPLDELAPEFRAAVAAIDPTLPLDDLRSMDEVIGDAVARPHFLALLTGLFAGLALVLAAVGTYGILAYLVAERRQEIGIRMALGADRGSILRLVLVRGLLLSGLGLVIGLAGSAALTRTLSSLLFNVTPTDPATLAAVAGVIALVAMAACLLPAWRAARVDPLVVLRDT